MLGGIGMPELIIIFAAFILLFGAKKLPELAKGLAQAINTFKKEANDTKQNLNIDDSTASSSQKDQSNDFNPNAKGRDWRPNSNNHSASDNT